MRDALLGDCTGRAALHQFLHLQITRVVYVKAGVA